MSSALRCWVSGRVQGVYYRASTREQALQLGLVGYARNLDDGRVEVLAIGPQGSLDELHDWLWQGPDLAYVREITQEVLLWDQPLPQGFAVL